MYLYFYLCCKVPRKWNYYLRRCNSHSLTKAGNASNSTNYLFKGLDDYCHRYTTSWKRKILFKDFVKYSNKLNLTTKKLGFPLY